jgi:acetyl esterase/lipase
VCVVALALVVLVAMASVVAAAPTSRSTRTHAAVRVQRGLTYATVDGEALKVDVYQPRTAATKPRPVIVLIHGGAWEGGDKGDLVYEAGSFASLGYVAVSIEYRLAPEHPYPAAVQDVGTAIAWLRAPPQVERWSIDPTRIGVLGASAGGNLASMLGTLGEGSLDAGSRVAAVVSWSGVYDFLGDVDGSGYLGCSADACPDIAAAASPVAHVDPTDSPTLLVHGIDDGIVPLSQAQTMEAALATAGVAHQLIAVPNAHHAQQLNADAWAETVAFFAHYLGMEQPS